MFDLYEDKTFEKILEIVYLSIFCTNNTEFEITVTVFGTGNVSVQGSFQDESIFYIDLSFYKIQSEGMKKYNDQKKKKIGIVIDFLRFLIKKRELGKKVKVDIERFLKGLQEIDREL